jgi:methylated-DNA-[protein]-cysteine S-methyltransferase
MTNFYTTMESPFGDIAITSHGGLITGLYTPENTHYAAAKNAVNDPAPFEQVVQQLKEYFAGKRRRFDVPLALAGTEFQKRVWGALQTIAFGETKSYGQLAAALGDPNASRAVGTANSKNPVAIIVPCHRVIGANGDLVGYNGGVEVKKWLLNHESKIKQL